MGPAFLTRTWPLSAAFVTPVTPSIAAVGIVNVPPVFSTLMSPLATVTGTRVFRATRLLTDTSMSSPVPTPAPDRRARF